MNVRYRVELSQAERGELMGLLSGGNMRYAGSCGRRFYWQPMRAPATRRSRPVLGSAARRFIEPNAALYSGIWRQRSKRSLARERAMGESW